MRRGGLVAAVALALSAVLLLLSLAAPAAAQRRRRDRERRAAEDLVVLTGRVEMRRGQTFDDVVILNGPARVAGRVQGDLVVGRGDLDLDGSVEGDVVVFRGGVRIGSGARVGGDVVTRTTPQIEEGATVEGEVRGFRVGAALFGFLGKLAVWLAYSFSTLVLGLLLLLLAPRAADAVAATWRSSLGPVIGWGFVLLLGLPALAVLALVTLVGIPLGLAILLALLLVYSIGYVASAWIVGRAVLKPPRSRWVAFLVGWGILRALALVPFLGALVWLAAVIVGLGALVVSAWRARRVVSSPEAPSAPAAPDAAPA